MTKAQKQEAFDGEVRFTYKDREYVIERDYDLDVLEAFEENQMVKAARGLLGEEQYKAFKETKPKMSDLGEFFDTAFAALGVSQGES